MTGGVNQAVAPVPGAGERGEVGSLGEGTACDKKEQAGPLGVQGKQLSWHTPDVAAVEHCGQDQVKDLDWVPGLLGSH